MSDFDWRWGSRPYVPVGSRRGAALLEKAALEKKGRKLSPVVIKGRTIAQSFWGKAWCRNLEGYSDYSNRLPRGRSYLRNGLVLHLDVKAGSIEALVRGGSLYTVAVKIAPVPKTRWSAICRDTAGAIDSLIELLQGRLSDAVGERICRQETGLFPSPREISFSCSCPDGAYMCKHVAAVLYGVGARLDNEPQLLFSLRKVNEHDVIASADSASALAKRGSGKAKGKGKVIAGANLSELFGLEMAATSESGAPASVVPNAGHGRHRGGGKRVATRPSKEKPIAKAKRSGRKAAPAKRGKSRQAPTTG